MTQSHRTMNLGRACGLAIQPFALFAMFLAMVSGCARDPGLVRPEGPPGIPYEVHIEDAPDGLEDLMRQVSTLAGDDPPSLVTAGLVRRRAEKDIPALLAVLHSRGYYKASVTVEVQDGEPPLTVLYRVEPGPGFTLGLVRSVVVDAGPEYQAQLPSAQELGLEPGSGFLSEGIPEGQRRTRRALQRQGYPFAQVEYEAVADFATNTVLITFTARPGQFARFGETTILDAERFDITPEFILSRLSWKPGDPFDSEAMARARDSLVATGLFSFAQFLFPEEVDEDGRLPMSLDLRERPPRTARAGLTYSTDLGPGVRLGWEHRNLLGEGESLSVDLDANFVNRSLESIYREPFFLFREDQSLIIRASLADEQPDAYRSQSLDLSGMVERRITRHTRIAGGLGFILLNIDDPINTQDNYALTYLPLFIERDTRDNLLDPTRGSMLNANGAPYFEALGETNQFFRYLTNAHYYWSPFEENQLVLAARARFGQIPGSELSRVPATVRFYAGGGGSVRGYEYKTLSTLDNGDPIGGRSLLETSAELRWRFTANWGIVTFLDGGRAFADVVPDFEETYRWGTGLGLRYYTAFGPIRADIAFPLNRRQGIDSSFQFYISIGQAF